MPPPSPELEKSLWKFDKLLKHPERAVTSWFTTPLILLIVRSIFLIYSLITLATSIYLYDIHGQLYLFLTYYTNLGFIGLTAYFATAVVHSSVFMRYNVPKSLVLQPKMLTIAFWLLYDTIVLNHIVIPLVYWAFLAKTHTDEFGSSSHMGLVKFRTYSMHGVDFFMMIVEVLLSRMPLVSSHLIFVITVPILYIFEIWINYAINHTFPYEPLDWRRGKKVAGYYFGLLGIAICAFLIQKLIHLSRDAAGQRLWRRGLMQEMETYRRNGSSGVNRPNDNVDVVVVSAPEEIEIENI
ncbi:1565_t:CDS:2 [Ambispora leptoticha]|uniref:1565_t:CDS:1 n=1 Tax=Ambispora leptoticha TaxID=144679 RepID=A0A9N9BXI0_9GLOM|nr:1565_t:CDS:2 [Ambispora leptoticha]